MKVYCHGCKHHLEGVSDKYYEYCHAPENIGIEGDSYYGPIILDRKPAELNKYNNCGWWENREKSWKE